MRETHSRNKFIGVAVLAFGLMGHPANAQTANVTIKPQTQRADALQADLRSIGSRTALEIGSFIFEALMLPTAQSDRMLGLLEAARDELRSGHVRMASYRLHQASDVFDTEVKFYGSLRQFLVQTGQRRP